MNEEGFWTYQHTVVQLEDCIDCVRVLLPEFDHVFLFDSSSGHRKKREGGLDATHMNNGYGGAVPTMRDTIMVEGCLGPKSPRMLQLGETQRMSFGDGDIGPFWMTPTEQKAKMNDWEEPFKQGANTSEPKKKYELMAELREKGVTLPSRHTNKCPRAPNH